MMTSFWPTPMAAQMLPDVAKGMNEIEKLVFSRTLDRVTWNNTKLLKGDLIAEVSKLKGSSGDGIVILGSGSIVAQLSEHRLIDEYQMVMNPIVLGAGRTMFTGMKAKLSLKRTGSRPFQNGNVVLTYEQAT
jgi:dihydrofolate reductase